MSIYSVSSVNMHTELLWAFIIIFTIDSIAPGPAVAMVMARGASIGWRKTIPFIAGLVVGDLFLFLMALTGLVALAKTLGPLFLIVKWVGVIYLLFLAYSMWTADVEYEEVKAGNENGFRSFLLATCLPLGNPKAVGFYVALLPAFMDVEMLAPTTAIHFSLVIVTIWSTVLISYTLLADAGRKYLKTASLRRWLNRGSAGAMLSAAGVVAFQE